MLTAADTARFAACIEAGELAVFPADTVYGLACAPDVEPAVRALYAIKRRPPEQPAAVMFFSLEPALAALPDLAPRTRAALERLLPGAVSLLLPNPARRFAFACGDDPLTLGLRVPALGEPLAALRRLAAPVLQSSANLHGEPDARRLDEVPAELRDAAGVVLDGGALPGTPSTVIDLRAYEDAGEWQIVREGAIEPAAVAAALSTISG